MVSNMSRARLVGGWLAAVAVLFAVGVVKGAPATTSVGELWLVAFLVGVVPSTVGTQRRLW